MKKWIAILALILCVALLAVACKTGDDGKDTDANTSEVKTEVPTSEATTEVPTSEEEPTDEVLPGGMVVVTGDDGKFGPELEPDQKN